MYISCSIFLARSILRTVELSMNYGTHKIHMIMPLIVVNRLQVHTTRVLGLISLLYRFHQCIVICFIIQHDDYQSGRFSKVITHKCRRFYTKIQNTWGWSEQKRNKIKKKNKICEIANCKSYPHFTASCPRSLSEYETQCFGAIFRPQWWWHLGCPDDYTLAQQ